MEDTRPVRSVTNATRNRNRSWLVPAVWTVTITVLVVLAVAVLDHLARPSAATGGMGSMDMSHALYRAGSNDATLRPLLGGALFTAWQLDAVALAVLVLIAAAYLTGVGLVGVRHPGRRWPIARTASFLAGLAVCGFATCGSIAVYDQVLFTAHMLGHLALVMVAPVLLVAGRPLTLLMSALPDPRRVERIARGRAVSLLTAPPVALACYAVVIVGSHLTGLMDSIMQITWAGQVEHVVYVLVGCQFFCLVVGDEPIRWRLATPVRWLLLAVAMAVDTFTGIVLMQGTSPVAMLTSPSLQVDALSDTRTGGAIMWLGGDAIMAVVMVVLVIGWLRQPALRQRDELGWGEQARRATFTTHTGADASSTQGEVDGFDDDDAARTAYNDWLAHLARRN